MKNPIATIFSASKSVLEKKNYKLWFFGLTAIFVAAYILLPVLLTPGNTLSFQLSIFRPYDYFLLFLLSAITALLVLMQAFVFFRSKKLRAGAVGRGGLPAASSAAQAGVGVFSALFGGLLATAACTSCIAAILGFLGAGSVFFVLRNQPYIVAAAIALVFVGLYFSARRVQGYCENCETPAAANNNEK